MIELLFTVLGLLICASCMGVAHDFLADRMREIRDAARAAKGETK